MISELTDRQILEFLMTSDFNENLSPNETKFLLLKFRNFYRVCSSRNDILNIELEALRKIHEQINILNVELEQLKKEKKDLSENLSRIKNKKLSIEERFFGKIIETK